MRGARLLRGPRQLSIGPPAQLGGRRAATLRAQHRTLPCRLPTSSWACGPPSPASAATLLLSLPDQVPACPALHPLTAHTHTCTCLPSSPGTFPSPLRSPLQPYSATDHTKYGKGAKKCPADGYCTNCMPLKVGRSAGAGVRQRLSCLTLPRLDGRTDAAWARLPGPSPAGAAAVCQRLLQPLPAAAPRPAPSAPRGSRSTRRGPPVPPRLPALPTGQGHVLACAHPHPLLPFLLRQSGGARGGGDDE